MAIINEGEILTWTEIKAKLQSLKHLGIQQFIHLYRQYVTRDNDPFK
jgi:hypothetical protein